jgi:hypothetical protein
LLAAPTAAAMSFGLHVNFTDPPFRRPCVVGL